MKIVINGTDYDWTDDKITYGDVVCLAYGPNEKRLMSVVYYWRSGETSDTHREGTMRPNGPPVKVASGMLFSVYHTGNA